MNIEVPAVSYGGRIGWTVSKPGEKPRIAGGTLASAVGGEDDDKSKNMIVNAGLDAIIGGINTSNNLSSRIVRCFVGTGTSETTTTMTSLQAEYNSGNGGSNYANPTSSQSNSATSAPWWHETTFTYQFPANGVDGAALSEVGFFNTSSSDKVMGSRVLFRDNQGNPTTVTILPGEQLTISYTIRVNVPTGDTTGVININGNDIGYTMRPLRASNINSWAPFGGSYSIGTFLQNSSLVSEETSFPPGVQLTASFSLATYTTGSFERSQSITATTSQANGDINMLVPSGFRWQVLLDTPVTKTSDDVLSFSGWFTERVTRA